MLNLNYGNQVERLADRLLERLSETTAEPLQSARVVVAHASMGRWLAQRKAARDGICANVDFVYPGTAIWSLLRAVNADLPADNPFRVDALALRILQQFDTVDDVSGLTALSRYLAAKDDLGWYRLARRLAVGFDQYLVFRPDWIIEWENGASPHWQAVLWQRLSHPRAWHWARCWQWLRQHGAKHIAAADLPARLSVFAVPGLAPSFLDCLARFAERLEIDVYQWSPSRHYWGDARSPRARAADAAADGNPLLPSLGLPLRDTLDWLLEWPAQQDEDFVPSGREHLLGRLQDSLLDYNTPQPMLTVAGSGIEILSCASRRREVEVCYDRLLEAFETDASLSADEVVVVSSRLEAYLPYVRAVFSRIPWNVHGGAAARGKGVVESFAAILQVLSAPQLDRSVLELLAFPAIRRRFSLRGADLADVRRWVREGGLFGGGEGKFSWEQGALRLIGATLLDAAIASWPGAERVHPSEAQPIGRFLEFLDALLRLNAQAAAPRPLREWAAWGREMTARCLQAAASDETQLRALRQSLWRISQLALTAGCERPVAFTVFRELMRAELDAALEDPIGAGASVTFASPTALRLIPARVVYALGLNEGEFPAPLVRSDLDLIAMSPRRGDRSRRQEDRQVFLEWLASARERLLLSYVGSDSRDGAELAASPLLAELLDHLDRYYRIIDPDSPGEPLEPSAMIVTRHPVQPFSGRYGREPQLVSYADHLRVAGGGSQAQPFQSTPLEAVAVEAVGVHELIHFIRLPAKHYLRRTLGIWLDIPEDLLPSEPPVALDALQRFRLIDSLTRDPPAAGVGMRTRIQSAVATPEGPPGEAVSASLELDSEQLLRRRLERTGGERSREIELDLRVGGIRLSGPLERVFATGRVVLHAGTIRGKHLLDLWVNHLLLNLAAVAGDAAVTDRTSLLIGARGEAELQPVADPAASLEQLLEAFRDGQRDALPFFPDTSRAYADGASDRQKAIRSARKVFTPDSHQPFTEGANPYVKLAFRDQSWLTPRFETLAMQIWTPLLEHLNER